MATTYCRNFVNSMAVYKIARVLIMLIIENEGKLRAAKLSSQSGILLF